MQEIPEDTVTVIGSHPNWTEMHSTVWSSGHQPRWGAWDYSGSHPNCWGVDFETVSEESWRSRVEWKETEGAALWLFWRSCFGSNRVEESFDCSESHPNLMMKTTVLRVTRRSRPLTDEDDCSESHPNFADDWLTNCSESHLICWYLRMTTVLGVTRTWWRAWEQNAELSRSCEALSSWWSLGRCLRLCWG